jgi:glycosyltransferase involved in cell wall biosynthesis
MHNKKILASKSKGITELDKASIIVPTYKRTEYIDRILRSLLKKEQPYLYEIIIVDSSGSDIVKELAQAYQQKTSINIIYLNVDNNISLKRNSGIHASSTEYLIFIDDDCIPHEDFVKNHVESLRRNHNTVNCGNIYFPSIKVGSSNYVRYRNSRHIPYLCLTSNEKTLDYKSIVTMNMSIRKEDIYKHNLFFNESFISYGMEDNEFGCRVNDAGLSIKCCTASIEHIENKSPQIFAQKMFYNARDGVSMFYNINPEMAMNLRYSFYFESRYIHKNRVEHILIKYFRVLFDDRIAKYILKFLNHIDSYKIFYFPQLYKYVFACYYYAGVKDRKNRYRSATEVPVNWYSDDV